MLIEVESSMGTIVASPTAGSCGALPGTLTACGEYLKKDNDKIIRGLLAAGMIGVFIIALYDISLKMPVEFRCTGLAELSLSKIQKKFIKLLIFKIIDVYMIKGG